MAQSGRKSDAHPFADRLDDLLEQLLVLRLVLRARQDLDLDLLVVRPAWRLEKGLQELGCDAERVSDRSAPSLNPREANSPFDAETTNWTFRLPSSIRVLGNS